MIALCLVSTVSWEWFPHSLQSLRKHANVSGPVYVDHLPEHMERDDLIRVEHDAELHAQSLELYQRALLHALLKELKPEQFLLVYEPVFLNGSLVAPQPTQGVSQSMAEYAAAVRARALNWETGVPVVCELTKALWVLDNLERTQSNLSFVQAYGMTFIRDHMPHPTGVLMLQSCEDVYQDSFEATARSCNVIVMPWQSHCARLFEFIRGWS